MPRTRLAALSLLGVVALLASATSVALPQDDPIPGPSFEDVANLHSVGDPRISPNGAMIAYTVRSTDWKENRYDTEIWLARHGEEPFRLTNNPDGSSSGPRWSPDGRWLTFVSDRGEERDLHYINPRGGEARPLDIPDFEPDINGIRWSPDGTSIAFSATEPETDEMKARKERYGSFVVDDAEYRMTYLWVMDVDTGGGEISIQGEPRRLTGGEEFTVGSFSFSPDGTRIAFDYRPDPLINTWRDTDISVIDVASGDIRPLVQQPMPDSGPVWSPDGEWILFGSSMGSDSYYYENRELALIPAAGGEIRVISSKFDENPGPVYWNDVGITFLAWDGTSRKFYSLDPDSGDVSVLIDKPRHIWAVDFSEDTKTLAISAQGTRNLAEIYRTSLEPYSPVQVTEMTEQVADWSLGSREVIGWKSKDGARIEGVLFKPADFDPSRRYPLLVIIHGGPTGISLPQLVPGNATLYPVLQWLAKGAVVMMPNYRGSAGYGEGFRSLNVRNLGVGDAWDVVSGVDYLIERGIADPERLGAMGWSQGGYISAFLTTTTDRFQAISVGAGISNWMTYYVNTDIHPFTRQYLKATPWDDPDVYAKTSPMTYIKQATTPTLIQHGEFDRRVPIPNAYELLQGLRDVGVESKLIVYTGFGHGINKPKERLAAIWHNWQWFARYIWDEEYELPVEVSEK